MSESSYDTDPGTPGTQLDPALLAAIQEAVAAGMAAQPAAAPPTPSLTMTTTPKLGLKQPALDDPALITDLNDNMTILDDAITATVVATLYNKTLEAPVINNPTITGWTNANHTHLDGAGGGALSGAAITSGYVGTGNLVRESALSSGGITLTDPTIRDTIFFAPEPTGAPDVSLGRSTAAGVVGELVLTAGAGTQSWLAARTPGSTGGFRFGQAAAPTAGGWLVSNAWMNPADTKWNRDDTSKDAVSLNFGDGLSVYRAAPGANPISGGAQDWTLRFNVDAAGTTWATTGLAGNADALIASGGPVVSMGSFAQEAGYKMMRPGRSARWFIGQPGGDAEGGSNAGSNLNVYRYADNGGFLAHNMMMRRADGWTWLMPALFTTVHGWGNGISDATCYLGLEGSALVLRRASDAWVAGTWDWNGNGSLGVSGNLTAGGGTVAAGAGQSLTLYAPGSIVVNPSSAYIHGVNNTVNLGHPSIPWAALFVAGIAATGDIAAQGYVKASGNGVVRAGSDAGSYCDYMYSGIFGNWPANFAIKGGAGFQFQPSNVNFFVIENSGNGFYTNTDNVVTCGRSGNRWSQVWSGNGSIQTCLTAEKTDFRGLDPEEALVAILRTPIQKYKAVRPTEAQRKGVPPGPDDDLLYGFDFVGFRAEAVDPLFLLDGDRHVSPQHTASIAVSGIQALYARIAKLEAMVKELSK